MQETRARFRAWIESAGAHAGGGEASALLPRRTRTGACAHSESSWPAGTARVDQTRFSEQPKENLPASSSRSTPGALSPAHSFPQPVKVNGFNAVGKTGKASSPSQSSLRTYRLPALPGPPDPVTDADPGVDPAGFLFGVECAAGG